MSAELVCRVQSRQACVHIMRLFMRIRGDIWPSCVVIYRFLEERRMSGGL